MTKYTSWALDLVKHFNHLIWHTPLSEISRGRTFLIKQIRIIILATRGFYQDKVQLRASALTFYSLLTIIPIVAIAFALAKGFELDQKLEEFLSNEFQTHQEVLAWILKNSRDALQATRGGYIAGVGMIILFWSVMSLLHHIENAFNHIWQIRSSRPWYRKFTDYLTIMMVAPIFIILSGSITVFISTNLVDYIEKAPILAFFKPIVSGLIRIAPYLLSWVALTVLFIIMPNTKVKFVPALISGIISGTIIQILQLVYWDLQLGITKLSAIYGSFAAFPLLVIWLQATWITVLLGAELCFANQNISNYEHEYESLEVSNFQKRALVLMIMNMVIRNFAAGEQPVSAEQIALTLRIPVRLVSDILQDLNNVNLVSEIHKNEGKERLYQPAKDINKLTVSYVFSQMDRKGIEQVMVNRNKEYERVVAMLEKFDKLIAKSDHNILLKDL